MLLFDDVVLDVLRRLSTATEQCTLLPKDERAPCMRDRPTSRTRVPAGIQGHSITLANGDELAVLRWCPLHEKVRMRRLD